MINQYTKGEAVKVSKNFKSTEFDCHGKNCCGITKIDTDLVGFCQMVRDRFNTQVVINSGFRCQHHNKEVGGVSKSKHMEGTAADIVVKGVKPIDVAKYCESIGVKGIGLYDWGCHIDTRTEKGFWESDKQIKRNTFRDEAYIITVKEWQKAAIKDGFNFPVYGADGVWGKECEEVAKIAVCKKRLFYKYKNLTKLVQRAVGFTGDDIDGKFGKNTAQAVKKWQGLMGIKADGVVGINTWKIILGVK